MFISDFQQFYPRSEGATVGSAISSSATVLQSKLLKLSSLHVAYLLHCELCEER